MLGPSAYVILDLFGTAGYKVFALVYPALLLALAHWLLLDWQWQAAAAHLVPLALAWLALLIVCFNHRPSQRSHVP